MNPNNWPDVREIYREGIETGDATLETEVPDYNSWDDIHIKCCRLVAVNTVHDDKQVTGWAALSPVSGRCVYGGVAEISVYVATKSRGRGVGTRLLKELVRCSEDHDFWTLQAGIFPENKASIRIHEKCGFRKVGIREKLGKLNGEWRDVVLMERRSDKAGVI